MTPKPQLFMRDDSVSFEPIVHGGRLDQAQRLFPNAPQPWIDLSTGINPHAFPLPEIAPRAWTQLPEEGALANLERIAARVYRVPAHAHVVAGAGSQSFIQWLPHLVHARRVAILGFSYAEHAARWRASGAAVEVVTTLDELSRADVAVVVNPNNPDGRLVQPQELADLGRLMSRHKRPLVVDEAFMDLSPADSVAPQLQGDMIVLRSLGKAYGLPGVRLGFALCSEDFAIRLREAMGPWSVSGPALAVGAAALEDSRWVTENAVRLERDSRRLDDMLLGAGFEILGDALLFRLVRHERAATWFAHLGELGILTRAFVEQPSWLRFGVPGDENAWMRLAHALEARL